MTSVERDRDSQPGKVIEIRSHGVSDSIKSQESSKSDVSSSNLMYFRIGFLNHSIHGHQVHHIRPFNLISSQTAGYNGSRDIPPSLGRVQAIVPRCQVGVSSCICESCSPDDNLLTSTHSDSSRYLMTSPFCCLLSIRLWNIKVSLK